VRGETLRTRHESFFLSVSNTSTVSVTMNVLQTKLNVFDVGITLLGISEVSLAATIARRLQLGTVWKMN
jgi:hypothetical protein